MARKQRKSRYHKRRRSRFLFKLLSVILVLAAVTAGSVLFFRVEHISVTGNVKYTAEEVEEASGVRMESNLMLLAKGEVARRILQTLPYVDEVNLQRKLPNTLVINLTECSAAAAVQSDGTWWLLSAKGKLLEQGEESQAAACIQVTGLELQDPQVGQTAQAIPEHEVRMSSMTQLLTALEDRDMIGKTADLDLSGASMLTFQYDGRFTVEMPMIADFDRKAWVLDEMVNKLEPTDQGELDLRTEPCYFRPE